MKLERTKEYHFGWMVMLPLLDMVFLLLFFLLLSSNFVLQPGISVSLPFSRFQLAPQRNQQIAALYPAATADHFSAIIWFDEKQQGSVYAQDWRLEDDPAALAAFTRAVRNCCVERP